MSEMYDSLEEASAALANTAQKAANLIRSESARAKDEALKTRREIDELRTEMNAARGEFENMRLVVQNRGDDRERIRRSAGWAWSSVGAMATILIFVVGWTCIQLTRGHEVANSLNARIEEFQSTLAERDSAIALLNSQLDASRLAEAKAQSQLEEALNSLFEPLPFENPVAASDLFVPAGPEPLFASISLPQEESELTSAE